MIEDEKPKLEKVDYKKIEEEQRHKEIEMKEKLKLKEEERWQKQIIDNNRYWEVIHSVPLYKKFE